MRNHDQTRRISRCTRTYACSFWLLLSSTFAVHADDVKATLKACGKPREQHAMSSKMYILNYQRKGVYLMYDKVDEEWKWSFATDYQSTQMLSETTLLQRMPCMASVIEAEIKQTNPKINPPATEEAKTGQANESHPAGDALFVCLIVGLIYAWHRMDIRERRAKAKHPVECPRCFSSQVQAGKRGWTIFSGSIGSNKTLITCLNCGNHFKPGRGR